MHRKLHKTVIAVQCSNYSANTYSLQMIKCSSRGQESLNVSKTMATKDLFQYFLITGCPLMILWGTLISLKYATWDQTVPNQEQDKRITGRAALRRVLGYVVHLLVDAATFLILFPQTLSTGICKTIVLFFSKKILLQDHSVSLLFVQLLTSNWRLTWVNSFIPSSKAKISLILHSFPGRVAECSLVIPHTYG